MPPEGCHRPYVRGCVCRLVARVKQACASYFGRRRAEPPAEKLAEEAPRAPGDEAEAHATLLSAARASEDAPAAAETSRYELLAHAAALEVLLNLPSRFSTLYATAVKGDGQGLPYLGPNFPTAQLLLLWKPNADWLRSVLADRPQRHSGTAAGLSPSDAGDEFARFLRARDPAALVLRVSVRPAHASWAWEKELRLDAASRAQAALRRLVGGLVFNLVDVLPDAFPARADLCEHTFWALGEGDIDAGIDILRSLPPLDLGHGTSQRRMLMIIDGLDEVSHAITASRLHAFLDVLQLIQENNDVKVIFTNERSVPWSAPPAPRLRGFDKMPIGKRTTYRSWKGPGPPESKALPRHCGGPTPYPRCRPSRRSRLCAELEGHRRL